MKLAKGSFTQGFLSGADALLRLLGLKRANVPAPWAHAAIAFTPKDEVKSNSLEGLGIFYGAGEGVVCGR
jgi:hypothetical protein